MAGRFDRQIATAQRLITKNGQSVTWRQLLDGDPTDANKPWKPTANTPVDYTVDICFLPDSRDMHEFIRYIKGTDVKVGSTVGLMGKVPFVPSAKDVVIRSGVEYRINDVGILAPNGQIILYTLEFMK